MIIIEYEGTADIILIESDGEEDVDGAFAT